MATVTLGITTGSSSNTSSYAAAAFTPTVGVYLVVMVSATGTIATANGNGGTLTDTQNLGWLKLVGTGYNTNADTMSAFISLKPAAASTETITWDCTGDNASGCVITVFQVAGMENCYVRQISSGIFAAAATPSVVMSSAILTGNPCVGIGCNGGAINTLTQPTGFTEFTEVAYTVPAGNIEPIYANSGITASTVTWGATSATAGGAIIVELYNAGSGAQADSSISGYYGAMVGP